MTQPFACKFSRCEIERHRCLDCGVNVIEVGDYVMLSDELWQGELGLGGSDNLCINCIEKRLGRKLRMFTDIIYLPAVEGYRTSATLLARIEGEKPKSRKRKAVRP